MRLKPSVQQKAASLVASLDGASDLGQAGLPKQYGLVRDELNWRVPPEPLSLQSGRLLRPRLSRWKDLQPESFVRGTEVCSDIHDDFHVLTIVQRRTKAELTIDTRAVWRGGALDEMLLTGPRQGRWRAIVYEPYDHLRLYLPQGLIAECHAAMFGHEPSGTTCLFETSPVEDEGLRHLAYTLKAMETYDSVLGPSFIDAVGLAFASRLVSLYCRSSAPSGMPPGIVLGKIHLRRVIDYIEDNISRPLFLSELSGIAGLGRVHFHAQFRAATGYSPHAYILHRRIARAQQMLTSPDATVVGVALDLGFSSQTHFTDAFRKVTGVAPGRWRQEST